MEMQVLIEPEERAPIGKLRLILREKFDDLATGYDFLSRNELKQFLEENGEGDDHWLSVFDCSGTQVSLET